MGVLLEILITLGSILLGIGLVTVFYFMVYYYTKSKLEKNYDGKKDKGRSNDRYEKNIKRFLERN